MVDVERLREAMSDSGMTIKAIANKSGILRETLYNKLSGRTEFTVSEAERLASTLHLTKAETYNIFFAREV